MKNKRKNILFFTTNCFFKMPEDALHINNKSTTQNTYDAIVIGSGISVGWAAKELTEKGLKVLMLERVRNFEHIKDYHGN